MTQVQPLFPEVGIIGFVRDAYGRPWQSRHQVLSRLAGYFNVIWCNPPRGWRAALTDGPYPSGGQSNIPGLTVLTPGLLESTVYKPGFVGQLTQRNHYRKAALRARSMGVKRTLLYLWRPEFAPALKYIKNDGSIYHIDDEYSFSQEETGIDSTEKSLMETVDTVFIHSPGLMEKKGDINPHTFQIPNGVDFAAYTQRLAEPDDLAPIPHPRIGYIGYMKSQVNFELLNSLARLRPDWSLVFIGPRGHLGDQEKAFEAMIKLPNVHYFGPRPMETLPAYLQHMDVGSICYVVNDYTKYIYPLKMHEYFAVDIPVVATPIRSFLDFKEAVDLAGTVDDWVAAIDRCLAAAPQEAESSKRRREIASRHDWDRITRTIAEHFCRLLGDDYVERLTNAENRSISSREQ